MFRLLLLTKVPSAYFAGVRLMTITTEKTIVSVRYKWFTKNPFGSLYFAVLAMAAEASTGILGLSAVYKRQPAVSLLITKIEGDFVKKAVGKIVFTCNDGLNIQQAVKEAINTGESRTVNCYSTGVNEAGETVATFVCTWSFKSRNTAR